MSRISPVAPMKNQLVPAPTCTNPMIKTVWSGYSNEKWWGKEVFGKAPAPKRIVDIVNGSNNVALG